MTRPLPRSSVKTQAYRGVVKDMLQTQDRPASTGRGDAGQHIFEDSAKTKDILRNVHCDEKGGERHTKWLDDDTAPGFTNYWIKWANKPERYLGKGVKMPRYLPEPLRRALLMQNLCEWAVAVLHSSVEGIVKQIDPNTQVLQMVIAPRRRFQLIFTNNGAIAGTHAVLLVVSPLAGDFILDPTAEQYGFPREHRFLSWSVYKELYIINWRKFRGTAVWSTLFEPYTNYLQESPSWGFWSSVKDELDAQTTAWLVDCDLKTAMDDEKQWKVKEEQLERLVVEGLRSVEAGPDS